MEYNRLKDVLDEQGVSQTELAERLNTSSSSISQICANARQPSMGRLFEMAEALGVPAYTLIADYNPKSIKKEIAVKMLSDFIDGENE